MIQETRPLGGGSLLAVPDSPSAAVLVLSGSSGRLEEGRARLLAAHGAAALAWQWFGGPDQPPGICEVPLESFTPALDLLLGLHPRLVALGLSKGAEAALLLAARDPRIALVVAISPSSVVWANVGPGSDGRDRPLRSSFSIGGVPLPFVPYDEEWVEPSGPTAFRGLYEQSLLTHAHRVPLATIPVERIACDVVVTTGGDDQVWPSDLFALQIADRRLAHGLETTVLAHPHAGHRVLLPGEAPAADAGSMSRGGTPGADGALGADLWAALINRHVVASTRSA